jgi:hypothetical protein
MTSRSRRNMPPRNDLSALIPILRSCSSWRGRAGARLAGSACVVLPRRARSKQIEYLLHVVLLFSQIRAVAK